MKKILTILTMFPLITWGQTKMTIGSACSYFGEKLSTDIYSFAADNDAQTSLLRITNASGLPLNFKLVAGNVPNACATIKWNPSTQGYDRYIIYNQTFMQRLKNSLNDWAALSILAHEVGHHLSGHSLLTGGSRPELELEADKFSGFILAKLGATLQQSQMAINTLANENYSATHPSKSARLAAIANGWVNASSTSSTTTKTTTTETLSTRPDRSEINIRTVKWKKSSTGGFWIYYKPTNFYFKSQDDYTLISLENGNQLIYWKNGGCYYLMPDYASASADVEYDFEIATCADAIMIKAKSGGMWIYDKGKNVEGLKYDGYNNNYTYMYSSPSTGKRYWIDYQIYHNSAFSEPKAIR